MIAHLSLHALENQMTERIDEIEKYFNAIETCDKWIRRLFWICTGLSRTLLLEVWPAVEVNNLARLLFVIAVMAHFIISQLNRFYFIPNAEDRRRDQLLSDSFNTPLTSERTHLYYNNPLTEPLLRLGADVLENSYFGKFVTGRMLRNESFKVGVYLLLWVGLIVWRKTDLAVIVWVTLLLFSGEIIVRLFNLSILRHRIEKVYCQLHEFFRQRIQVDTNSGAATILQAFSRYEATKAFASLKQSSKIFHANNEKLSQEWDRIKQDLGIEPPQE